MLHSNTTNTKQRSSIISSSTSLLNGAHIGRDCDAAAVVARRASFASSNLQKMSPCAAAAAAGAEATGSLMACTPPAAIHQAAAGTAVFSAARQLLAGQPPSQFPNLEACLKKQALVEVRRAAGCHRMPETVCLAEVYRLQASGSCNPKVLLAE